MRKQLGIACAAVAALVGLLAWLGRDGQASLASGAPAAREDAAEVGGAALQAPPREQVRAPADPPEPAPTPAAAPAERSLLELLEALARAEGEAVRAAIGQGPREPGGPDGPDEPIDLAQQDVVATVERAVTDLLVEPAHVWQVLGLLESGELREEGAAAAAPGWSRFAELARLEYASCRALYWAVLLYNDPGDGSHGLVGRTDGRTVVLDVVTALPRIEGPAHEYLLECVGEARRSATGLPVLDKTYLPDLLAVRGAFADHEALFWRLLAIVKESMTPDEIRELDRILGDPDDPVAARERLAALFDAGDHDLALLVARQAYAAASSAAVRRAIAGVVASTASEVEAAAFLTERIGDAKGWTDLWLTLGRREHGTEALDAAYVASFAEAGSAGAGPAHGERTREMSVTGMLSAREDRLLEIFAQESSPRIRGQALLTMAFRDGYEAHPEHLDLLARGLTDGTVEPTKAVSAAYTMTAKAPPGSPARDAGIALLTRVRDTSPSDRVREQAATWLQELD
jgi:hypothetical protein